VAALYTATTIGSEFMPPLDEETALFMPITDPRSSLLHVLIVTPAIFT